MKITCDIISDLLPLYIDEVCTEDTKSAVEEHIGECGKCRDILENMSLDNPINIPEKTEVEKAKKPFKKLRRRFTFWLIFGIFCTSVIIFTLNVAGAFDNLEKNFYRSVSFLVEDAEAADEWVTISEYRYFDGYSGENRITEDYLEIRGLFPKKELCCSFPDSYSVKLRILDENGNVVIEPFDANGGMMNISVKELKSNTKYYVQYISDTGGNFAFNLF